MNETAVLAPLLDSLCRGKLPSAGRLAGQRVIIKRKDCSAWICLDSQDNVHFLVSPAPANHSRFKRFKMRLLSFGSQEWVISQEKVRRYIDIACRVNRKSAMRRPFLGFCEDVLLELARNSGTPDDAIYKTALRWQRFWNTSTIATVTDEWIHGLGAELLFLRDLLGARGLNTLRAWTGAAGHDQDFQANGIGIEIKATLTQPPILQISNLNQLDTTLFESLYVLVYNISSSTKGHRLPALVKEIEDILSEQAELTDLFWRGLSAVGYRRQLEERYNETSFSVNDRVAFHVDAAFPKLTSKNLSGPLDSRIRDIQYSVRLAGMQGMAPGGTEFKQALAKLAGQS